MTNTTTRKPFRPGLYLLLPMALFGAFSLACGLGEQECNPSFDVGCEPVLSPTQQKAVNTGRSMLLGTWTLEQQLASRDDVDRKLFAGTVTYEVEIFSVDIRNQFDENDTVVKWSGALRAKSICMVPTANFNADNTACDELIPAQSGVCSSHECDRVPEREVSGTYDTNDDLLHFNNDSTARVYHHNPTQGYINLNVYIIGDLYLAQGGTPTACESTFCNWSTSPRGLFEGIYPTHLNGERTKTFLKLNDSIRSTPTLDTEVVTETIGAKSAAEEKLLGDWNVKMTLGSLDDLDRPITIGNATYTMEIFEVSEGGDVGDWNFIGALKAEGICLVSATSAEAGAYNCDDFAPAQLGSCNNTDCTPKDEIAIDGIYNELDNSFTLDEAQANTFYIDPAQGFIYLSIYVKTDEATLASTTIPATECKDSWCSWTVRSVGAFEETYPGGWMSAQTWFEMGR